MSFKIQ